MVVGLPKKEACGSPSPPAECFHHLCRHVIEGRVNIGIGLMDERANERAGCGRCFAALLRRKRRRGTARIEEAGAVGYWGPLPAGTQEEGCVVSDTRVGTPEASSIEFGLIDSRDLSIDRLRVGCILMQLGLSPNSAVGMILFGCWACMLPETLRKKESKPNFIVNVLLELCFFLCVCCFKLYVYSHFISPDPNKHPSSAPKHPTQSAHPHRPRRRPFTLSTAGAHPLARPLTHPSARPLAHPSARPWAGRAAAGPRTAGHPSPSAGHAA